MSASLGPPSPPHDVNVLASRTDAATTPIILTRGTLRRVERGVSHMSKPRYRYAHQQTRNAWRPIVAAGEAYCAEPVCKFKSRLIPPEWAGTQLWHVCHDPSGTVV